MSTSTNSVSTWYTDNSLDSNFIIDFIFLQYNSPALYNYNIIPNLCKLSNHIPLIVELSFYEENNQSVVSILKTAVKNLTFSETLPMYWALQILSILPIPLTLKMLSIHLLKL